MDRVRGSTRVLAVVGHPVEHSLSPTMHNAAIAALGLDAVYIPLPASPTGLQHILKACGAAGIAGNITIPHKVAAAELIVRLSDRARELDAVNTFWPVGERLAGDNTDVVGILEALDFLGAEEPWLVAGTGGSARAVVAAARERGASILLRSRNPLRARDFAAWSRQRGVQVIPDDERTCGTAINATPLGLNDGDALPIPLDRLDGCRAALDLVYRAGETSWCRSVRKAGIRTSDGRSVLVGQGVEAFRHFFPSVDPPREVMRAAVDRALAP